MSKSLKAALLVLAIAGATLASGNASAFWWPFNGGGPWNNGPWNYGPWGGGPWNNGPWYNNYYPTYGGGPWYGNYPYYGGYGYPYYGGGPWYGGYPNYYAGPWGVNNWYGAPGYAPYRAPAEPANESAAK